MCGWSECGLWGSLRECVIKPVASYTIQYNIEWINNASDGVAMLNICDLTDSCACVSYIHALRVCI